MIRQNRRKFLATTGIAASFAALGLPVSHAMAQDMSILRARIPGDLQVLDPAYMLGGLEMSVQFAIFPRLVELDLDSETLGWKLSHSAARVEQIDATQIEFELKPGLMWSNGFGEVTAEDVAFSYARQKEGDWAKSWGAFSHVEVTGPYTGTIILAEPFAPFMTGTMSSGVGTIQSKAAFEAMEEDKFALDIPAAAGPYRIKEITQRQKVVLEANPDWTATEAEFDEIHLIVVESEDAAVLAFEAGELDVTAIPNSSIERFRDNPPEGSNMVVAGNLQYSWVGMNIEHPKLTDIRVRQAIQRGINLEQIQQVAFRGVTEEATGMIPPGILGRREARGYDYDPDAARALLEEAGVTDLELDLVTLASARERLLAAQIIQQNLGEIGITINVKPLESGQFWALGREGEGDAWKDSQLWIMRFGGGLDPNDFFQWFGSDQIGNWNWTRWTDPEYDALFKSAQTMLDPADRQAAYERIQELMEQSGSYVWLNHEPEAFLYSTSIKPGIDPYGTYVLTAFDEA